MLYQLSYPGSLLARRRRDPDFEERSQRLLHVGRIYDSIPDEHAASLPSADLHDDRLGDAHGTHVAGTRAAQVAYKYQTQAELAAMQAMIDQLPSGPESDASKQRSFRIRQVTDNLRAGKMTVAQAWQTLPPDEAKQAVENSRLTPLQAEFKKLPMLAKLNVWDVATNPERDDLWQELWKARTSYMQRHSPQEREDDPTWIRMQTVFPDLQALSPAERQLTPTHVYNPETGAVQTIR